MQLVEFYVLHVSTCIFNCLLPNNKPLLTIASQSSVDIRLARCVVECMHVVNIFARPIPQMCLKTCAKHNHILMFQERSSRVRGGVLGGGPCSHMGRERCAPRSSHFISVAFAYSVRQILYIRHMIHTILFEGNQKLLYVSASGCLAYAQHKC